jgi:hypothetical protein
VSFTLQCVNVGGLIFLAMRQSMRQYAPNGKKKCKQSESLTENQ